MAATFTISPEVRDVLARSSIDETSVKLPEQLARDLYVQVDKVLKGAGGKWNRKAGAHLFERDPRELLGLAVETGEATNIQQQLQQFFTPDALADRMVRELGELPANFADVLEPSAGNGQLVRAVMRAHPTARVVAWDIDPAMHGKIDGAAFVSVPTDCLKVKPEHGALGASRTRRVTGRVFTFGYSGHQLSEVVEHLPDSTDLWDIRFSARSRDSQWNARSLAAALGDRYTHASGFGNRNYKNGGPIELVEPDPWVRLLEAKLAKGESVILMCGCAQRGICHRAEVASMLSQRFGWTVSEWSPEEAAKAKKRQPEAPY